MNAEAHLRAQGWQGPGNGLRAGSLQRAILTSKKTDLKGLGARTDESDQWWDNIFSKQLSNITVGAQGAIGQVNGGIQAAHPVAARSAHRKQFGSTSALEKIFVLSEVLKGSELSIPLTKNEASPQTDKQRKREKGADLTSITTKAKTQTADADREMKKEVKSKKRKSPYDSNTEQSTDPQPLTDTTKQQLSNLSDKALRQEARRLKREARVLEKVAKAERKEMRRLKRLRKASKTV
ncbi:protein of unknown function [Taphrina deformans PYCC 5710]|uniref:G-patch domain-containing protein n=1 Tax=Taphrina deformans (strain PYCC 5710 / ATCC 11124 / CBS 356.35 / IMI 108563 / JCM 9778 / NBRC 8474) TaxID=1097556 RepID=R4XGT9_TAPDE|nr:protein of unknown function [Taphrina deformans PYCC 5710]|eukprot:CCG85011.1 protein of unknown function [Taphrina deformans PYCC 5710]